MVEFTQTIGVSVVVISACIALIILLLFPRLNLVLKLLGLYILISASTEILSLGYSYGNLNNLYLLHAFVLLEFWFLTASFFKIYEWLGHKKKWLYFLIPGISLIVFNSVFIQQINTYNSYSATFNSFIIIGYCLYFFYLTLEHTDNNLLLRSVKWIIISIFLYHCASLTVLLFSNAMLQMSRDKQLLIWMIRGLIILSTKVILLFQFGRLLYSHFKPKNA